MGRLAGDDPIYFSPFSNSRRTLPRPRWSSLSVLSSHGGHRSIPSRLPLLRSTKMAPPLEDLTRVLAELAARLSQPPAGGGSSSSGDSLSASISSLAAALNPSPDGGNSASSGTRVLDAALSLMCFDPLEVRRHPRRIHYWIVSTVGILVEPSC